MQTSPLQWKLDINIEKAEQVGDERLVFGWANVAKTADGAYVVDSHGEIIREEDLERAAYEYMEQSRRADRMHGKDYDGSSVSGKRNVGHLVECMVFTTEKLKHLGLEGKLPVGLWVGIRVPDEDTWQKAKNGDLKMFSIGGFGTSVDVDDVELSENTAKIITKAIETAGYDVEKPKVLTNLRIVETSLVDVGANPGSHIVMTKRSDAEKYMGMEPKSFDDILAAQNYEEKIWKAYDAIWSSIFSIVDNAEMADVGQLLAQSANQFAEFVGDLTPANLRSKESDVTVKTEPAAPTAPSIADLAKSASADEKAAMLKALGAVPACEVEKVRADLDKQEAANKAMAGKLEKLQDDRDQEAMEKRVSTEMSKVVGVDVPTLAKALRSITEKCGEETLTAIETALKATSELAKVADAMSEEGTDTNVDGSAFELIESLAADLVAKSDGKLDLSDAMQQVMDRDPELSKRYYAEIKSKRTSR